MAKESRKTTAFGVSPESFNESRRSRSGEIEKEELSSTHKPTHNDVHSSAHKPAHNDVHSSAHKPTHNDVHNPAHNSTHKSAQASKRAGFQEPQAKERKKKRVHLLTYESLIDRMDAYALRKGVKRVDVFESVMTAFLDQVEKEE